MKLIHMQFLVYYTNSNDYTDEYLLSSDTRTVKRLKLKDPRCDANKIIKNITSKKIVYESYGRGETFIRSDDTGMSYTFEPFDTFTSDDTAITLSRGYLSYYHIIGNEYPTIDENTLVEIPFIPRFNLFILADIANTDNKIFICYQIN